MKVRLNVFGTEHTTYTLPNDKAVRERVAKLAVRNPGAKDLQRKLASEGQRTVVLTEIVRGPNWDPHAGIKMTPIRPRQDEVVVSWLRSAYLMVFSLLGRAGGYRYAESEAVQSIREQLMNPTEDRQPCSLWDLASLSGSKNLIVMKRLDPPLCWIVKIGKTGVMLPNGGAGSQIEEVIDLPEQITVNKRNILVWKPTRFGRQRSFELVLRSDSEDAGRNLFGRELWVPLGEQKRRFVVASQHGLTASFLPITVRR